MFILVPAATHPPPPSKTPLAMLPSSNPSLSPEAPPLPLTQRLCNVTKNTSSTSTSHRHQVQNFRQTRSRVWVKPVPQPTFPATPDRGHDSHNRISDLFPLNYPPPNQKPKEKKGKHKNDLVYRGISVSWPHTLEGEPRSAIKASCRKCGAGKNNQKWTRSL